MSDFLDVIEPGLFTTVQDRGRLGFMDIGVAPSGALDALSLRSANALVGNDHGEGALEMCRLGGRFRVATDSLRFAFAGAEGRLTLDDEPIAFWRSHVARRGQVIHLAAIRGNVAYMAVQGGFAIEPVLGSLSTYTRSAIGGFKGRRLHAEDRLPLNQPEANPGHDLALPHPVPAERGRALRVVLGPHQEMFTDAAIRTLLTTPYTVTRDADRIGVRLEGAALEHAGAKEIVSDANTTGCMQVPGNGQPIALMADRHSCGGYPKIATIITADMHRLGQAVPGTTLRFEAVAVEQAEAAAFMLAEAEAATFGRMRDV
ncbi:biotin-dependent carboxyltransferase [Rhodovarius crocodyli]|uniref:Biotin-dependent carboxyltransferase n=1 Tax=Rhodovarius crocodyli TaxID=1979269 RepID=A0A437ME47_9PROT|nr:biotin-dependent carboxyltransferase family protein [Rhodovarius crocodyli]RVT95882.1 biotin-dependent carboxyltransferase [Rhodovarius crocodyli]